MTTIKLKKSDVPGKVPLPSDLELGELALNVADGKAFVKTTDDEVLQIAMSKPAQKISELKYPLMISHRGGSLPYPEHSMRGFIRSYLSGFIPELDIQALADDELLCIHDTTVNRTMGLIEGPVVNFTRPEIEKAYVKNSYNKSVETEAPVFFEDVLDELGGKIVLAPEIKASATRLTGKIIQAVKDRGLDDYVLMMSFDYDCCKQVANAGLQVVFLSNNMPSQPPSQIIADGINFVGGNHNNFSAAQVQTLKSAGLKVLGYTINTKEDFNEWINVKGADGVTSDDPWYLEDRLTSRASLDFSDGEDFIGSYAQLLDSADSSLNSRVSLSAVTSQSRRGLSLKEVESANSVVYFPQLGEINLPCQIVVDVTVNPGKPEYRNGANYAGFNLIVPETEQDIFNNALSDKLAIAAITNGKSWVCDKSSVQRITNSPISDLVESNSFGRKTLIVDMSETEIAVSCPEDGIYEKQPWGQDVSLFKNMLLGLRASKGGAVFHSVEVLEYGSIRVEDYKGGVTSFTVEVPNGHAVISSDGSIVAHGLWGGVASPGANQVLATDWDLSALPTLVNIPTVIVTPRSPNPETFTGVSAGGTGNIPTIYTIRNVANSHHFTAVLHGRWK